MGFFKKIFRPIRKVLDKVVPNEIKPFLPYAAAAVPFLAPASFGANAGLGGLLKRGLVTGVLPNVASQLAQEGADDDINFLSAALAGVTGGLTATDAAQTLLGARAGTDPLTGLAKNYSNQQLNFLQKMGDKGLGYLAKGADFLGGAAQTLKNPGMNMETLKAASIPFIQGTGDAMAFEAESAMRAYEAALADYNAQQGALGNDAGRREAILSAMRAYNHPEELIETTLAELGLRDGGRVGLEFGGIPAAVQAVKDKNLTNNLATSQDMQIPIEELVQEFIKLKGRQPNDYDELMDYYRQKYGTGSPVASMTEKMTGEFAADGGIMGRQPFVSGGFARGLKSLVGMGDEVVDLSKQKEVFRDGPITAEFLQTVDKSIIDPAIRTRDTGGVGGYGMYNNLAEMPAGLQAAELISRIRKPGGGIDYEAAEIFIGKKLRGNETIDELIAMIVKPQRVQKAANGGIMEYNMGGSVLPDGIEMDYRGGGFIPMGSKERADDVPARVSKNEFVMTADAVRAAGGGSVNKGAERMYDLMNNLEARA
jgi:hypothetical protein